MARNDVPDDDLSAFDDESGDDDYVAQLAKELRDSPTGELESITSADARRWEEQFLHAFEAGWQRVTMLPNPIEGNVYDVTPAKEFCRRWDEKGEAKRQLLRNGRAGEIDAMPVCGGIHYSIVRRPLFGSPSPRVSVVAYCHSPLKALARGPIDEDHEPADIDVLDEVMDRLLVDDRQEIFYFIALCSTCGWSELVKDPLPEGKNYLVALVEPKPPGWLVLTPKGWPPALRVAIEPEGAEARRSRVLSFLEHCDELSVPGGLLLMEEVAERNVVDEDFALNVSAEFAAASRDHVVERVEGSDIIRRKR